MERWKRIVVVSSFGFNDIVVIVVVTLTIPTSFYNNSYNLHGTNH
jgi:hypothetical protein